MTIIEALEILQSLTNLSGTISNLVRQAIATITLAQKEGRDLSPDEVMEMKSTRLASELKLQNAIKQF